MAVVTLPVVRSKSLGGAQGNIVARVSPTVPVFRKSSTANKKNSPSWRWDRAVHIMDRVDGDYASYLKRRSDDQLVVSYILPFVIAYNEAAHDLTDMDDFRFKHPDMCQAREIHRDNLTMRYMLEAMICSDAPISVIADNLAITEGAAWWFEKMFFDVREYLDSPMWMAANVFFTNNLGNRKMEDYLWKCISWKHGMGIEGLSQIINPISGISEPLADTLQLIIRDKMAVDAVMAIQNRNINSYNENLVIEQFQKDMEIRKLSKDGSEPIGEFESNLKSFLTCLSGTMGMAKLSDSPRTVEARVLTQVVDIPDEDLYNKAREDKAAQNVDKDGNPVAEEEEKFL